jgi:VNT family MFS transporter (synaptic vesicle glycoprotein 2)
MALGMTALPAVAWLIIPLEIETFTIPFTNMEYSMWRVYIVACSLTEAVVFLCLLYMPESGKFTLTQGQNNKTLDTLRKIYRWNTGKPDKVRLFTLFRVKNSL